MLQNQQAMIRRGLIGATQQSRLLFKRKKKQELVTVQRIASFSTRSSCPYRHLSTATATTTSPNNKTNDDAVSASVDKNVKKEYLKPYSSIPGNWRGSFPIIGTAPMFIPYVEKTGGMRTEDFMYDHYTKFGGQETGLCRFGPPGERALLVFDESFLNVLNSGEQKYPTGILESAWPIQHYNDHYQDGVQNPFLAKGEDWRRGRMALNPYIFNIQTAQTYIPAIAKAANLAMPQFEKFATSGKLDDFCNYAAVDMFMAASLGLQIQSAAGNEQGLKYFHGVTGPMTTMGHIATHCQYSKYDVFKFSAWKKFVQEWTKGRQVSKELVDLALKQQQGSGKGIMHGFLKDDNLAISPEEATEMNLILTFAAAETTSSLIHNVLNNLSKHVDIQEQVRQEMQRELGGQDYHADAKLPYLEQVLKETQRLTPSLPWVNVKAKIPNDVVLNGYLIPAGTTCIFSHMGIKHDEALAGPHPLTFDPDRFTADAIHARKGTRAEFLDHPLCSKPFGVGARMCVGSRVAKLKYTSLLTRILQDYRLEYNSEASSSTQQRPSIRLSFTTTREHPCPVYKVTKVAV